MCHFNQQGNPMHGPNWSSHVTEHDDASNKLTFCKGSKSGPTLCEYHPITESGFWLGRPTN